MRNALFSLLALAFSTAFTSGQAMAENCRGGWTKNSAGVCVWYPKDCDSMYKYCQTTNVGPMNRCGSCEKRLENCRAGRPNCSQQEGGSHTIKLR